MKPTDQIQTFLAWFYRLGVNAFDIHVRMPLTPSEDYKKGNWIWITQHEGLNCEYIHSRLLGWIKQKNANGADIYFRPHKDGSHRVVFLDDVQTAQAIFILKKYGACVIETHPGNTQVWLSVDRALTKDQRKQAQIFLKNLGFTDPGSVSGDHLGRLCGLRSQKRKCWVNLLGTSDLRPWSPNLNWCSAQSHLPLRGGSCASQKSIPQSGCDTSDSGREWGWVMGMLRSGMDANVVTERLIEAATRRGKKNAEKYACYTVRKAASIVGKN